MEDHHVQTQAQQGTTRTQQHTQQQRKGGSGMHGLRPLTLLPSPCALLQDMSSTAIAQLLSNTLYYKRFFPYYTFNVLAGLDNEGKGAVFGYDAIGSFERIPYGVTGSGSALITSILDNQVEFKTHLSNAHELSIEECLDLVKDVMTSAGERDIYTGDSVDIVIISKDGMREEKFQLKKD